MCRGKKALVLGLCSLVVVLGSWFLVVCPWRFSCPRVFVLLPLPLGPFGPCPLPSAPLPFAERKGPASKQRGAFARTLFDWSQLRDSPCCLADYFTWPQVA